MSTTKKRSRRNQKTWADQIKQHIWLAIPLGVVGLVIILAITRGHQNPSMLEGVSQGQVEAFEVTSPGQAVSSRPATLPGEQLPDLGQEHIDEGESASYNSNPPTSGPHYKIAAAWGIYDEAPVDEKLVHNLEHGGIVISYNPNQIQEETLEQLRSQVRELSQFNPRIILTPKETLDAPLALTAWTYLQKLDRYDPAVVKAFYDAHIGRGPECQNGSCPI
jgi:hypothetical protein